MQKCANLVELEKYCNTNIHAQKSASIQPRSSTRKFGKIDPHLPPGHEYRSDDRLVEPYAVVRTTVVLKIHPLQAISRKAAEGRRIKALVPASRRVASAVLQAACFTVWLKIVT